MNNFNKYKNEFIKNDELNYISNINKLDISIINNQIGGKYNCFYKNKFDEICKQHKNGKYNSKKICIDDCETQYIHHQVLIGKLKYEASKFFLFIKELIENGMEVYIKGGNVLGLKILRLIYKNYKNSDNFEYYFNKFLELNLIKDWDFIAYSKKKLTDEYKKKIDIIAVKYKLILRAKTFILYQISKPKMTDGKALYEIAIYDYDAKSLFSQLEIPLTTMIMRVDKYTLKYVFMFSKCFLEKSFDTSLMKRLSSKIHVTIHNYENGMYKANKLDTGTLNGDMIKFILKYKKYNVNLPQFLITHTQDLTRMILRLIEKNIPKTEKINNFLINVIKYKKKPQWLIDTKFIIEIINKFTKDLGNKLLEIYKSSNSIEKVNEFLTGVRLDRIESDYNNILKDGLVLVKNIFYGLIQELGSENINKLNNTNKFYKLLKFLLNKL